MWWKHTRIVVLVALVLGVRPAIALPDDECRRRQGMIATAIELRLADTPFEQAVARRVSLIWRDVVVTVYASPPRYLTGEDRQDALTGFYQACTTGWTPP